LCAGANQGGDFCNQVDKLIRLSEISPESLGEVRAVDRGQHAEERLGLLVTLLPSVCFGEAPGPRPAPALGRRSATSQVDYPSRAARRFLLKQSIV